MDSACPKELATEILSDSRESRKFKAIGEREEVTPPLQPPGCEMPHLPVLLKTTK